MVLYTVCRLEEDHNRGHWETLWRDTTTEYSLIVTSSWFSFHQFRSYCGDMSALKAGSGKFIFAGHTFPLASGDCGRAIGGPAGNLINPHLAAKSVR